MHADGHLTFFTDKAPEGAAGQVSPAVEKDPVPPDPEKDPGPSDPKKDPDPATLKTDAESPAPEIGDVAPVPPSPSSQGPQGEAGQDGGAAEGGVGQPAALPEQTATAEASEQKLEAKEIPSGHQDPEEPTVGRKAAEDHVAARRGSPAFLHSPSCPAVISR